MEPAQSSQPSHPASTGSSPPKTLTDLPRELRDTIYGYAVVKDCAIKLISCGPRYSSGGTQSIYKLQ